MIIRSRPKPEPEDDYDPQIAVDDWMKLVGDGTTALEDEYYPHFDEDDQS